MTQVLTFTDSTVYQPNLSGLKKEIQLLKSMSTFNRKSIFKRAKYLLKNKVTAQYKEIAPDMPINDYIYSNYAEWVNVNDWATALKIAWYEARMAVYKNRIELKQVESKLIA